MSGALLKFGLGSIILLGFFVINASRLDPDLGWHLRVGQEILAENAAPRFDSFSHTMPGHTWVDHEWLTDAALAFMHSQNLWHIVVILFTALAFLPFAVWLRRASDWFELGLVALLAIFMTSYMAVRPHLLTFFLFFGVFEILTRRYVQKRRDRLTTLGFYLLPLIFLIWVNLHGGFFLGLLTFGVFLIFSLSSQSVSAGLPWRDFLIFAASAAATLVNPYQAEIYGEIFRVLSSADTGRYIKEWQSVLVMPSLAGSGPMSVFLFLALLLFLPAFLCLLVKYRKRYPRPLLIVGALYFLGYLRGSKLGPIFFVSAFPILTLGFQFLKQEIWDLRKGQPFSVAEQRFLNFVKLSLLVFILSYGLALALSPASRGSYPDAAAAVLRERAQTGQIGNIFNDYGWGGYLIWAVPEIKVFIDGRMPHWRDATTGYSAMAEYVQVLYPEPERPWQWEEIFAKHDIQTVLLAAPRCERAPVNPFLEKFANDLRSSRLFAEFQYRSQIPCRLVQALLERGWDVIYKDEVAIILQRQ